MHCVRAILRQGIQCTTRENMGQIRREEFCSAAKDFKILYPERQVFQKKHKYDKETHNKYANAMARLKSKKERGVSIFVENRRVIMDLLAQGKHPSHVFYVQEKAVEGLGTLPPSTATIQVTERQMSRLTDLPGDLSLMAVFGKPQEHIAPRKNSIPLIVYLNKLKKPGNVGTIIRSAAGAQCLSVVTSPETVGMWLSSTLRASAGANFLIPIHDGISFSDVLQGIPSNWGICFVDSNITDSPTRQSIPYYEADFTRPTLMVFGSEGEGIPGPLREEAVSHGQHSITDTYISTHDRLDSLNVAMAATVLIYEMAKQQAQLPKALGTEPDPLILPVEPALDTRIENSEIIDSLDKVLTPTESSN